MQSKFFKYLDPIGWFQFFICFEIKNILIAHELKKNQLETKNYLELQNKEKIITQNFGNVGECYVVGNF